MAETIFMVRHGEAESNVGRYFGGWYDSPLTALGREQAKLLHKRLSHEGIGKAFCSDLGRTKDTLSLMSLGCPVEYSSTLREKNYGRLEGVSWKDEEEKFEKYHSDPRVRAPGGENLFDVYDRIIPFFENKIFQAKEEKVLVVSHHEPLVLVACHVLGMPLVNWRRLRLGNCGLSIINREGKAYRLKLWNSLSHSGLEHFGPLLKKETRKRKKE